MNDSCTTAAFRQKCSLPSEYLIQNQTTASSQVQISYIYSRYIINISHIFIYSHFTKSRAIYKSFDMSHWKGFLAIDIDGKKSNR